MEYGTVESEVMEHIYIQIMSPSSTTPSYLNTQNAKCMVPESIKAAAQELDSVSFSNNNTYLEIYAVAAALNENGEIP